ncbi:MAG TPA: ornithine cyclodeaminase family protein [Tahibacter sp.]|uniref:ornithine cyclodeaminase family protein n=1 Tax=Tahibacter sp. TaxID=2056211 RepID=UPI002BC84B89|nr:ornithine cyclodeaminase family protein [Tahibacter sp.]HSX58914.1 ornithine cyclodeaminase family protein [Tahibacter sp.]
MTLRVIDAAQVRAELDAGDCIALLRDAMIALSDGRARQPLRGILDLDDGDAFGLMPGALADGSFGAKLISVFPRNFDRGLPSHQGAIVLFDRDSGAPVALVDASAVTAIRTAAASALATDALARRDAQVLALLGYGEQAATHLDAIARVRTIAEVRVWGRSRERAEAFAERHAASGVRLRVCADVDTAVAGADIVCCLTAAQEPILFGRRLEPGMHVNLVGSGRAGPVEVDHAVVLRARFFADHRESVLRQGAEFLRAKQAGLVGDAHVLGEIGEVLAGRIEGRRDACDITLYKSLGSIVQDLAAAQWLVQRARARGFGTPVRF